MPRITISKTKLRRGTNTERKSVVFDQGEAVYTIDTNRLFVGTGTTAGGIVMGSKVHPLITSYYTLSQVDAEVGDLVNVNNIFYQLTATNPANIQSWGNVGAKIDTSIFNYNSANHLTLSNGSVSAVYINPNTVLSGVKIDNGILQVDYNPSQFKIVSNKLTIGDYSIDSTTIASSAFGGGITGGSGDKIVLNLQDSNYLRLSGANDTLVLTLTGDSPFDLTFSDLLSDWFIDGLNYNATAKTIGVGVNIESLQIIGDLSARQLSMLSDATSGSPEWSQMTVDVYGRVVDYSSSIYDTLTGYATTANLNNSLSAIFNGIACQTLSGALPGVELTYFEALSSNGTSSVSITLSSAGFITFEGNSTTRTGKSVGRFAIPIFSY